MIFRMEQQWVLLPLLVCQNGNCPPSRRVLRLMSLMTPRNARGGSGEAKGWTDGRFDGRECGSLAHFGIVQDCRETTG